jgi:uncharacterized glyoxalase superfamily protein PhnB
MAKLTRVAPEVPVMDLSAALEYYVGRLGFEVAMVMPSRDYAIVERDGVALHLFTASPGERGPVGLHVFVSDLEGLFDELRSRGASVSQEIVAKPWGNREFRVTDPAGNTIKFTEPTGEADE